MNKRRQLFGSEHPATLTASIELARILMAGGQLQAAYDVQSSVLPLAKRVFGDSHSDTLRAMDGLAESAYRLALLKESRDVQEAALRIRRRKFGLRHSSTSAAAMHLFETLRALKDFEASATLYAMDLEWLAGVEPGTLSELQRDIRRKLQRINKNSWER